LFLLPAAASATWWNDEWKGRKQFSIDTGAAGVTDPIGPAAVLVRLHTGNFKLESLKEDGSDLRVIAADDKTPLKYHLEKFDPLLGEALLWVGIPDLKPGSRTNFWIYSGNPKAASADDVKGTYDSNTALVYHFAERGQPPKDSSNWGNHALTAGQPMEGAAIGRGLKLEGGAPITIPGGPSLVWAAGGRMTWSVWFKPADADATGVIYSRREGSASLVIGLQAGKPFVEASGPAGTKRAAADAALPAGSWHQLAVVGGDAISLYVDGARVAGTDSALPALSGNALLGGDTTQPAEPAKKGSKTEAAASLPGFKGELDELQIAKVERPPGFIRLSAISQGPDSAKLMVPGQEEQSGGFGSGYLAIILQSVTPDGWVVIGLLGLMAMISWMVMAGKASYLSRVEKANRKFAVKFREASGDLARFVERARDPARLGEVKIFQESPLYRVFATGAQEIHARTDGTQPLHAETIEAIRAGLDASVLRENQQLNKNMVLLTIAISGGPFLGLLGTVVGVMITFAAIAAAGDVNVNAIAPGIAAALVATVAGLGVAIPALFGYNWLLTRIKSSTTTMQVFVDELVTKMAEAYSERAITEARTRPTRFAPIPPARVEDAPTHKETGPLAMRPSPEPAVE
jgi:biopolymer transport protein ExbB